MNKENVLQLLVKFINGFVYNKELISELTEIISKTGGEKRFFTLMVNKLRLLAELGLDAVQLTEFENIGQGIFSMHLATKLFNIRILYGFCQIASLFYCLRFTNVPEKEELTILAI